MARVPKVDGFKGRKKKTAQTPGAARHNDKLHIETQAKRERALSMRMNGVGYAEIGHQLGVSVKTAWQYVQDAMAAIPRESAEKLRDLEEKKMDSREAKVNLLLAKGGLVPKDLCKAIDTLTRIQLARARIFGLMAPEQHQHTGRGGGPIITVDGTNLTDEQIERLRRAESDEEVRTILEGEGDGRSRASSTLFSQGPTH